MAMDISSYYTTSGRFPGSTKSSTNTSSNMYSTSFADYFLTATSASNDKTSTSSLFSDLSSFGMSSSLESLLGGVLRVTIFYLHI